MAGEGEPVGDGDYQVRQGDCLISIANASNLRCDDILDHPRNKSLKDTRKDPTCLLPGDRVFVPPVREGVESAPTESRNNKIQIKQPKYYMRARILVNGKPVNEKPVSGKPVSGKPVTQQESPPPPKRFHLEITTKSGSYKPPDPPTFVVPDDGIVQIEIPADAQTVVLTWPPDFSDTAPDPDAVRLVFQLGELDPIENESGFLARLANLGYPVDLRASAHEPPNDVAIRQFAKVAGVEYTQGTISALTSKLGEQSHLT